MAWEIRAGHVLNVLKTLSAESVHCVVTSPPYWGLRDYKVDGQVGLEKTPEDYVATIVKVFQEIKRVLRKDGTLWLNLGDSYVGSCRTGGTKSFQPAATMFNRAKDRSTSKWSQTYCPPVHGLKPKDLTGIPWRVAFALQADGWYLRSDVIWAKPNPMPESVTDRPTKSHEYVFLLTKSAQYFYDAQAIAEPSIWADDDARADGTGKHASKGKCQVGEYGIGGVSYGKPVKGIFLRNKRTVWTIPTQAFSDAHFATFPEQLVEPCIRAGTSERGCCAGCGAPWERGIKKEGGTIGKSWHNHHDDLYRGQRVHGKRLSDGSYQQQTVGRHPTCLCTTPPRPATVLDPFCGSGTTGVVALKLQRNFLGIDLNPDYVTMAMRRIDKVMPLFDASAL